MLCFLIQTDSYKFLNYFALRFFTNLVFSRNNSGFSCNVLMQVSIQTSYYKFSKFMPKFFETNFFYFSLNLLIDFTSSY